MIALLQRVREAKVEVAGATIGAIGPGVLALIGVRKTDAPADVARMLERILGYRVFADAEGRMNRSLADTGGGLLLVPQFTLAADTRKGMRAGFQTAAEPARAQGLFEALVVAARVQHRGKVETGQFGADMQLSLVNDGPVTFWLETHGNFTPD
jgi:D-aminoacyl-tRNA deacylase